MPEVNRKLAAVMSADVAGYSRLMQDDDAATVTTLQDYRAAIARVIERHKGRVVNAPGDNILAEFPSAVEALQGACEIQEVLRGRNLELPEERRMEFRIGVNLGDVIEEDDGTIYGDGVNIAARLEALADAGGICISNAVYESVESRFDFGFEFLGAQEVKNIERPVNVYRVRTDGRREAPKPTAQTHRRTPLIAAVATVVIALVGIAAWQLTSAPVEVADAVLALPDGPAIAVLPFENDSGDAEQDFLANGITEDLIVRLSRFDNFFVIARNSTAQFKGTSMDVREIGNTLGARFVIEGSVRRTDETLRVSIQLLDAVDGTNLWAETYDRDPSAADLFAIQDDITAKVSGTVGDVFGIISRTDLADILGKPPENLSAYECWLRLVAYYDEIGPEKHMVVRSCAERAVETDPDYGQAWVTLAWTAMDEHRFGFNKRPDALDRAFKAFRRAIDLEPKNQLAHQGLAEAHFANHNVDAFIAEAERAIALNPNNSTSLAAMGDKMIYSGRLDRGIDLMRKAIMLNPHHPDWFHFGISVYDYRNGDYDGALEAILMIDWPDFHFVQVIRAATYGQLGRLDEARTAVKKLLEIYPDYAENGWREFDMWNHPQASIEHFAEGLSKAGLDIRTEPPPATD